MKSLKLIGLLVSLVAAGNAVAHGYGRPYYPRSSVQFGIYVGDPWLYPTYPRPYFGPRFYSPPVIVSPSPVYIEQSPPVVYVEKERPAPVVSSAPALESGYWYFCNESQSYYPYVKECAGAWQRVAPAPAEKR